MKLPAGYYIEKHGANRQLCGPQGSVVATGLLADDHDIEILAHTHWRGYHSGVLHALREIGRRQQNGRVETLLHLDAIEHDLLHQVHIV